MSRADAGSRTESVQVRAYGRMVLARGVVFVGDSGLPVICSDGFSRAILLVVEPRAGPDAMESPALPLELVLTLAVAVACALR